MENNTIAENQPDQNLDPIQETLDFYIVTLPGCGDVLKFRKTLSTELYYKIKRDIQTVSFRASSSRDVDASVKMPLDIDYFPQFCLEARGKNGEMRAIDMKYVFSLSLSDSAIIEQVCTRVSTVKI